MKPEVVRPHIVVPQEDAAIFVSDMLRELAGLSAKSGLDESSKLIRAVIPVLEIEARRDQKSQA